MIKKVFSPLQYPWYAYITDIHINTVKRIPFSRYLVLHDFNYMIRLCEVLKCKYSSKLIGIL